MYKNQSGFTLIELAIVMIIIGLLIGGILKGQELVGNARVTATVAQIKGIDGAISTFRDKYSAMPGDIQSAFTRLPNCTANPCRRGGNADGRIDINVGGTPGISRENTLAFVHLAAADLISGVQNVDGVGDTGGTQVLGTGCVDGSGAHNEAAQSDTCKLFIRVQS
jgi:prepilin-type N-terminal cleavage/methylation domain-containing protein